MLLLLFLIKVKVCGADVPFFLLSTDPNSHVTVKHLKDWETCQSDGHKV